MEKPSVYIKRLFVSIQLFSYNVKWVLLMMDYM